jgi:hypothetical protein
LKIYSYTRFKFTHLLASNLLASEVSSLSESKVRDDLDHLFLLMDSGLYQILDRNHSLKLSRLVDKGQVANIGSQHFVHAGLDRVIKLGGNQFAASGGNLLDFGIRRCPSEQSNFGDVVTFTDNTAKVACLQ